MDQQIESTVFVVMRTYGGWGGTEPSHNIAGVFDAESEAEAFADRIAHDERERDNLSTFDVIASTHYRKG